MPAAKNPEEKPEKKPAVFVPKLIPQTPGCYLFFDKHDQVIYVGKAKKLRPRVASYFRGKNKSPKLTHLVNQIARIETRTVNSDVEALIMENNLIKSHQPKFNVLMRDDKSFLYLRITRDPIPKLEITRRLVRDGSFYFGPKTSAKSFRRTVNFCQKIFGLRTCRLQMSLQEGVVQVDKNPEKRRLPCIDFDLQKCSGPCTNEISAENYAQQVEHLKKFLRGDTAETLKSLQQRMETQAQRRHFEAAAKTRDLMQSIEISTVPQLVQSLDRVSRDVWGIKTHQEKIYLVRLAFRHGKLLDQSEISFRSLSPETSEAAHLMHGLWQFYERTDDWPAEILLPLPLEDAEVFVPAINQEIFRGKMVKFWTPQRRKGSELVALANKNARLWAEKSAVEEASHRATMTEALPALTEALGFAEPPERIEGYDISHFGGTGTVASMVVMVNGELRPNQYRRFKLKSLAEGQIDDFQSMREILWRRLRRQKDGSFATQFPDLIMLDGGLGQLNAGIQILQAEKEKLPENFEPTERVIALAKREETIFRGNSETPLSLDLNHPGLKLLQRLRDEAHRFAVSFQRSVRQKTSQKSALDEVPGIGPQSKKKLLQHFGSVAAIRQAEDSALEKFISAKQLLALRKHL